MSDKALQVAKDEILRTIKVCTSSISDDDAVRLSQEVLDAIDWKDSFLMHKGIAWITRFYLQNRLVRI